jgi:hypothetical protein
MIFQLKIEHILQKNAKVYLPFTNYGWIISCCTSPVWRGIFLLPFDESSFQFLQNLSRVLFVIEIPYKILTLLVCNLSIDLLVEHIIDFDVTFIRQFGFYVHFEEIYYSCFKLRLHKPKLLIDLVSQYLAKYSNVIVLRRIFLDTWNYIVSSLQR